MRDSNDEAKFIIDTYYNSLKKMFETSSGKFEYLGNPTQNDYTFQEYIPDFYETGFSLTDLVDSQCKFYIVHPDEVYLKRNIYGTVVDIFGDDNTREELKK